MNLTHFYYLAIGTYYGDLLSGSTNGSYYLDLLLRPTIRDLLLAIGTYFIQNNKRRNFRFELYKWLKLYVLLLFCRPATYGIW